ncbi:hypothetical protein B0H21DRAFT_753127, partial [Amylocystis lapponica]
MRVWRWLLWAKWHIRLGKAVWSTSAGGAGVASPRNSGYIWSHDPGSTSSPAGISDRLTALCHWMPIAPTPTIFSPTSAFAAGAGNT